MSLVRINSNYFYVLCMKCDPLCIEVRKYVGTRVSPGHFARGVGFHIVRGTGVGGNIRLK